MSYSILKKTKKQPILVIFKLFIGWKGVENYRRYQLSKLDINWLFTDIYTTI